MLNIPILTKLKKNSCTRESCMGQGVKRKKGESGNGNRNEEKEWEKNGRWERVVLVIVKGYFGLYLGLIGSNNKFDGVNSNTLTWVWA